MTFDGQVLFATGGGSGIAAASARRFVAGGGRVAVVDLDLDRAEAVAADLDGSIGLAADVADEASVERAVRTRSPASAGSTRCSTPPATRSSVRWTSGRWSAGTGC